MQKMIVRFVRDNNEDEDFDNFPDDDREQALLKQFLLEFDGSASLKGSWKLLDRQYTDDRFWIWISVEVPDDWKPVDLARQLQSACDEGLNGDFDVLLAAQPAWTADGPAAEPSGTAMPRTVTLDVPVLFSGVVSVQVPTDVSPGMRRPLAEKVALARILTTLENPDAPEADACAAFAESFDLTEEQAGEVWDRTEPVSVLGGWTITHNE
jgi:hypothetical protein